MSTLPPGWAIATIADVTEYLSRGKQPKYADYSSLPVVNQRAIQWSGIQNKYLKYVDPTQFDSWESERFIQPGDILWNSTGRGTVGRAYLVTQKDVEPPKVVDSHVTILRPNQKAIDPSFLFSWVRSSEVQDLVESLATGATNQIELGRKAIASVSIPVAPIDEQTRIIRKLDSLLARVDECCDRLVNVASSLELMRQSIFNVATSGDLTRDWVHSDHPKIWQEVKLEDLFVDKPRNGYSPRAVDYKTETRSLSLTATTSGIFDPKHIKYIDENISENSRLWLEPGDILIQRANSLEYVGVSAIYDGPSKRYIYPDLMMKCRANDRVLTKYLYYLLSSSGVRSYFRKNATGTTGNMPKINQKIVLSTPVTIPNIAEQREIVARTTALLSHVEKLEFHYQRASSKASKIVSSLLSRAFRGELVPQHLGDESARVLLERIRSLKEETEANMSKIKKQRNTKSPSSTFRSQLDMLKREDVQPNYLSKILNERGSMSAESLWTSSQLEIDDFYDQLKEEEENGLLRELRDESDTSSRSLEAICG